MLHCSALDLHKRLHIIWKASQIMQPDENLAMFLFRVTYEFSKNLAASASFAEHSS